MEFAKGAPLFHTFLPHYLLLSNYPTKLKTLLHQGFVPLPKTVTPSRIEENIAVFDFELTNQDMDALHTNDYSPVTWDPTVDRS